MQLYLDMDGVLANFDKRAADILGQYPASYEKKMGSKNFWEAINKDPSFYRLLEPMPDCFKLYKAVHHLDPIILTGVPSSIDASSNQKTEWVAEKFGPTQKIICCQSKKKSEYCSPGDVIIDDRNKYKPLWVAKGGIWIEHISANDSIEQLKILGII